MFSKPNLYVTPCLTKNRLDSVKCVQPNQRGFSPKFLRLQHFGVKYFIGFIWPSNVSKPSQKEMLEANLKKIGQKR